MRIKMTKKQPGNYDTDTICPLLSIPANIDWVCCRGKKCAMFIVERTYSPYEGNPHKDDYYGHCGLIHKDEEE